MVQPVVVAYVAAEADYGHALGFVGGGGFLVGHHKAFLEELADVPRHAGGRAVVVQLGEAHVVMGDDVVEHARLGRGEGRSQFLQVGGGVEAEHGLALNLQPCRDGRFVHLAESA